MNACLDDLKSDIQKSQTIALCGGSTPKLFLPDLIEDLRGKTIAPTDDRRVPDDHPDCNRSMLETLIGHPVISLDDPALVGQFPLDLVVLGMGLDGHIASLFPGYSSEQEEGRHLVEVPAPTHIAPHVARVSLTVHAIMKAQYLYLIFAGQDKKELWNAICKDHSAGQSTDKPAALLLKRPDLKVIELD